MVLLPDDLHNTRTVLLSCIHKDHKYNVDLHNPHYCNLCLPFLSPFSRIGAIMLQLRIFHTYSVYTLLFHLEYLYLLVETLSLVEHHNGNYDHNFCSWSFNFLDVFFIKNTNACCNIITYRTSILFLF